MGQSDKKGQRNDMKAGTKKKLALQWKEDKGFAVAVRMQSSRENNQNPTNVLVLSEKKASFARVLSVAAAA